MRAVVQRVNCASVSVNGEIVSAIDRGLLVFLGVETGDTDSDLMYMVNKLPSLRIFDDENGMPNCSVLDCGGSILLVSQFTLCGDARHGRRPGYSRAARPEEARTMYDRCAQLLAVQVPVQQGVFQADMQVSLVNDGPFTILLDSRRAF
ncbi:MAG: D-aminoacyl-tRNA deacylase [bacterium]|nr:D-aminoacyl-tRNA deacylase [bacterium]